MGYKNRWKRDRAFEAYLLTVFSIVIVLLMIWVVAAGLKELTNLIVEAVSVH